MTAPKGTWAEPQLLMANNAASHVEARGAAATTGPTEAAMPPLPTQRPQNGLSQNGYGGDGGDDGNDDDDDDDDDGGGDGW